MNPSYYMCSSPQARSQVHKINITKNNLLARVCNVIEWIILFAGYWHFHWDLRASGQTGFIESPGQGVLTTSTYFSRHFWKRDTKYNPFQCWPVGDGIKQAYAAPRIFGSVFLPNKHAIKVCERFQVIRKDFHLVKYAPKLGVAHSPIAHLDPQLRSVFHQVKIFPNDPKSLGH